MKLPPRLNEIAKIVKKDSVLVDVGCDHGFLPIYLAENNLIKKAYACDVNEGPLENVQANIKRYGVENKIQTLLSDGLMELQNISFDTLVVAGMGGSLIIDILANNIDLISGKQLVLQPNINAYGLRKWLLKHDLNIVSEHLVKDQQIIYEIIEIQGHAKQDYTELELLFGRANLQSKSLILQEYLENYYSKLNNILKNIPENNNKFQDFNERRALVKEFLDEII